MRLYNIIYQLILYPLMVIVRHYYGLFLHVKERILEQRQEKLLGIKTCGLYRKKEDVSLFGDETIYAPLKYSELLKMIEYLKVKESDIFFDLGCGSGRVIFALACHKIKKAIGVELRKTLVDRALTNQQAFSGDSSKVSIIHQDVATLELSDGTIIYTMGSLGWKTTEKMLESLKDDLQKNPRRIRVIVYELDRAHVIYERCDWLNHNDSINDTVLEVWENSQYRN